MDKYDFETHALVHRRLLWLYALKLCRRARAMADEVLQEALTRAFVNWASFCPDGDPVSCARNWLYRIVYTTFLDEYNGQRKVGRWLESRCADMMAGTLGDVDGVSDPPEIQDCGLSDTVVAALDAILPAHREVVELVDVAGCSYKQAARRLGLPIGTVMSGLSRGRRALRKILAEYARAEHGIGMGRDPSEPLRPGHSPARLEPAELPQAQAHGVDRVVTNDDAPALLVG